MRPELSTVASYVCVCLACVSPCRAQNDGAAADAARARLQKSFETACKQFDSEKQADALAKCNLAWFRANERDVWRLNLNPHARSPAPAPSS